MYLTIVNVIIMIVIIDRTITERVKLDFIEFLSYRCNICNMYFMSRLKS